ncbi:type IV pilin [Methanosarcina barkeri]|uniref:Archaeal Type IV pilin N-terminal domain-containing protein n=1 Tax=Methanosarcina barkeri CM1 TaxID=796385 RepID=A0A0G3CER7_METBA|nr:type IV pilin N-terminal domain-containing protein [Methanosarcina barkeri]AKJ39190.1 hypothetical protein MCM1_2171 [Methanosarcina barkeri CM1]
MTVVNVIFQVLKVSGGLSCPNTFNQEGEHMDFKKLFRKDDKAVSPVIGVILMVAITVILAAAIGSSVFSKGAVESAPQANFDIKAAGDEAVKIEHLGGDSVNFATRTTVKAYVNDTEKDTNATDLDVMSVGDIKTLKITDANADSNVNIKIIDNTTNQLICDKNIRF